MDRGALYPHFGSALRMRRNSREKGLEAFKKGAARLSLLLARSGPSACSLKLVGIRVSDEPR
jgi:hypothetical protein